MKIYLASRYSRREELVKYRTELQNLGLDVQARWLDGKHQLANDGTPIGDKGEKLVEGVDDGSTNVQNAQLRSKFAQDDWEDVSSADLVINFTEAPRSSANRGGRHVEFGIALARNARVIVVGHRENIFHWLPCVEFVQTFDEAKQKRRLEIMARDNFVCRQCANDEETLNVHHRWYIGGRKVWEYPDVALITLCEGCHSDATKGAPVFLFEDGVEFLETTIPYNDTINALYRFCEKYSVKKDAVMEAFVLGMQFGAIDKETVVTWRENAKQQHADHNSIIELKGTK